jgi:hypothetical protein
MEPVCGALLGLIIYHERLSGRPGQIAVDWSRARQPRGASPGSPDRG